MLVSWLADASLIANMRDSVGVLGMFAVLISDLQKEQSKKLNWAKQRLKQQFNGEIPTEKRIRENKENVIHWYFRNNPTKEVIEKELSIFGQNPFDLIQ